MQDVPQEGVYLTLTERRDKRAVQILCLLDQVLLVYINETKVGGVVV